MKKRILASTMASVMALSAAGTTLVSSAATADFKDESVVSVAELRKFLEDKEMVALAEDGGLENYGTYSVERFTKAYSLAQNVVDKGQDATPAEITAAFQILKAAKKNLVQYTKTDLAALVNTCKGIYETQNILNEEYNLTRYTDPTWSKFADAYANAEDYLESDDLRATTDAYEELYENRKPVEKDKVTKIELERAMKAYEDALKLEHKYQPWQRGTVTAHDNGDFKGKNFAWGVLYQYVASGETALKAAYTDFNSKKNLRETTDADTVNAVKMMNQAAALLNNFNADTFESGSETKVKSLLKKYHGQMVKEFVPDATILAIVSDFVSTANAVSSNSAKVKVDNSWEVGTTAVAAASGDINEIWNFTESGTKPYQPLSGTKTQMKKITSAELRVRAGGTVYAILTTNKLFSTDTAKLLGNSGTYFYQTQAAADAALAAVKDANNGVDAEVRPLPAGEIVLSNYIDVTLGQISGNDAAAAAGNELPVLQAEFWDGASAGLLQNVENLVTAALAAVAAATGVVDSTQAKGTKAYEEIAGPVAAPSEVSDGIALLSAGDPVLVRVEELISTALSAVEDAMAVATDSTLQAKGTKSLADKKAEFYTPADATADPAVTESGHLKSIADLVDAALAKVEAAEAVTTVTGLQAADSGSSAFSTTKEALEDGIEAVKSALNDVNDALNTAKSTTTSANLTALLSKVTALTSALSDNDLARLETNFVAATYDANGDALSNTSAAAGLATEAAKANATAVTRIFDAASVTAFETLESGVVSDEIFTAAKSLLEEKIGQIDTALKAVQIAINTAKEDLTKANLQAVVDRALDVTNALEGSAARTATLNSSLAEVITDFNAAVETPAGAAPIIADVDALATAASAANQDKVDDIITNTVISDMPAEGSLSPDETYSDNKTALTSAITAVKSKLDDVQTAITAAKADVKGTKIEAVVTAANAVKTALEAADLAAKAEAFWKSAETNGGVALTSAAVTAVDDFVGLVEAVNDDTNGTAKILTTAKINALKALENTSTGGAGVITDADSVFVFNSAAYPTAVQLNFNNQNAYAFNNYVDSKVEANKKLDGDSGIFTWISDDEDYMTVADAVLGYWMAYNYYGINMTATNANQGLIVSGKSGTYDVVDRIDANNYVTDSNKSTTNAQKLIYNYLKYAIEDRYNESNDATYGWKEVQKYYDDAYTLAEKTVECSLFSASHMQLVAAREDARDWLKARETTKPYVDKESLVLGITSTDARAAIKGKYDQLNNELKNFAYSYEDIINEMSKVAALLDDGKGNDGLREALYDVADKMLKVKALVRDDSTAFEDSDCITEDGELKLNNRLYTNDGTSKLGVMDPGYTTKTVAKSKGGDNQSHYDLKTAYEKMVKAYDAITNPETKPGYETTDLDGDNDFTINDVIMAVQLNADGKFSDVTKYDYSGDGKVDINDVVALLQMYADKT